MPSDRPTLVPADARSGEATDGDHQELPPVSERCTELSIDLAGVADRSTKLDRSERRHVERCLRCQAELAQYRKLLRAMQALRAEVVEPAPGLLGEVLAAIEAAGERQAVRSVITGRRVAYFGGIAAATAAGAAGAIALAARSRRSRLPLAG